MTVHAFDPVAATYDAAFTHHPLGRWLRAAVHRHLFAAFRPGDRVLELGCGTGEDAVALARHGVSVHATDASLAMLAVARGKSLRCGLNGQVQFARLDLAALPAEPDNEFHSSTKETERFTPEPPYDGAFSNFGALNCVRDRRRVGRALSAWVRPGGRVVLVVMGPLCPWEWLWYGLRGRLGTALRRFRPGIVARLGDGAAVRVWYPSPRRLRREFAPYFRPVRTIGIGVVLPPSFARGLVDRRPRLFERLARLDAHLGAVFPGTWLNDHYLLVLERTSSS